MLDSKITFIHIRHGSFILEVFTLIFLRPNPLSPYQIQRLQSLKCMKHNETCKVSDWVEYVIWCVDPLTQVNKYAGKVYSVANISTVCDRVSFQTPSEVASRANTQQTTTKVFRRSVSRFTWHRRPMETWRQITRAQWTAQEQICVHAGCKGGYELSYLYESPLM